MLCVAEAPGAEEAKVGVPLVGQAGKEFDALLRGAGLERDPFRIANCLNCRPPGNVLVGAPYEAGAIAHCRPNLDKTILEAKPKVILAFGNTPLSRLCGVSGITRYRGYVLQGPFDTWVVPTYHPSYLLPRRKQTSSSKFRGLVVLDIKKGMAIAKNGFAHLPVEYLEDPTPERAARFADEYEQSDARYLANDLETPYKLKFEEEDLDDPMVFVGQTILRVSFAFRPRYAMSIPWTAPYMPTIRRLYASRRDKCGWNSRGFDRPILLKEGVEIGGEFYDAMDAFHVWQPSLPRGLEFATSIFGYRHIQPWKHFTKDRPAFYSCVDADATITNMLGIEEELKCS